MAYENFDGFFSLPAAADLSANQYQFGLINTSGQVALVAAAGVMPHGLIHNAPASGEQARLVSLTGVVLKAKAGGTLAVGDKVSVDATGKLVKSVTSTHLYIGIALEIGASGQIVSFLRLNDLGQVP